MSTTVWKGASYTEVPDSPEWDFDEQIKATVRLRGNWDELFAIAPLRGTEGTGDYAGMRVEKSTLGREKGGIGTLTIIYTGAQLGDQLPADEITMEFAQLEQAIEKNDRYASKLTGTVGEQRLAAIRLLLQDYATHSANAAYSFIFTPSAVNYDTDIHDLFRHLQSGVTNFLLFPPVLKIKTYSWTPFTDLSIGGIIESPPVVGFTLPDADWLRLGDSVSWNGTHWSKEMRWQGAPEWDTKLYPTA